MNTLDRFLARLSHRLSTKLTFIDGFLCLEQKCASILQRNEKSTVQHISQGCAFFTGEFLRELLSSSKPPRVCLHFTVSQKTVTTKLIIDFLLKLDIFLKPFCHLQRLYQYAMSVKCRRLARKKKINSRCVWEYL